MNWHKRKNETGQRREKQQRQQYATLRLRLKCCIWILENSNSANVISHSIKIDSKLIDCFLGALDTQMTKSYCKVIAFITVTLNPDYFIFFRAFIVFFFSMASFWQSICFYDPHIWPSAHRTHLSTPVNKPTR